MSFNKRTSYKYSKLTNTIVTIADAMSTPNKYFVEREYDDLIGDMNEYLVLNAPGFEDFTLKEKILNTGVDNIKIPMYFFKPIDQNNPYVVWLSSDMNEINCTLNDAISVKDAIENEQGLISFSIRPGETLVFKKKYVTSQGLIKEEYYADNIIRTDIIAPEHLSYYYSDKDFEKNKVKPESAFKFSKYWSHMYRRLWVHELGNNKYQVDITDCDGRPEDKVIIEGESLYSAYYNYMVQNGYFKANQGIKTK